MVNPVPLPVRALKVRMNRAAPTRRINGKTICAAMSAFRRRKPVNPEEWGIVETASIAQPSTAPGIIRNRWKVNTVVTRAKFDGAVFGRRWKIEIPPCRQVERNQ